MIPVVLVATKIQWLETTILLERLWNLGRALSGFPKVVITSLLALHHWKVPQGWPPNMAHGKAAPDSSCWLGGLLELSSRVATCSPSSTAISDITAGLPQSKGPRKTGESYCGLFRPSLWNLGSHEVSFPRVLLVQVVTGPFRCKKTQTSSLNGKSVKKFWCHVWQLSQQFSQPAHCL